MVLPLVNKLMHVLEYPLVPLERRIGRLEPELGLNDALPVAVIGLLLTLSGWTLISIEWLLSDWLFSNWLQPLSEWLVVRRMGLLSELLHFFHHPVFLAVPLGLPLCGYVYRLNRAYKKDKRDLTDELKTLRLLNESLLDSLKRMTADLRPLALELFQEGLSAGKEHEPFQPILQGLTPTNRELATKVDSLEREVVNRLKLLKEILVLPAPICESLSNFLGKHTLSETWGPLYVTFAVQLQLEPWTDAGMSRRYMFIRDIRQFLCLYDNPQDAHAAFQHRLEKDLETILLLVNGTLWSVMYRDIRVWEDPAYWQSNAALLARLRNQNTSLRRLFVFDPSWTTDPSQLRPLVWAAKWHIKTGYSARFTPSVANMHPLVETDPCYIASCLINDTRILMEQEIGLTNGHSGPSSPIRYTYNCNTGDAMVADYKRRFDHFWHHGADSSTPLAFLDALRAAEPKVITDLENEFDQLYTTTTSGESHAA